MTYDIDDYEILPYLQGNSLWSWLVQRRAGFRCEECGASKLDATLHSHHIDEDRSNNCIANGQSLCASCHNRKHRGVKYQRRSPNAAANHLAAMRRRGQHSPETIERMKIAAQAREERWRAEGLYGRKYVPT